MRASARPVDLGVTVKRFEFGSGIAPAWDGCVCNVCTAT